MFRIIVSSLGWTEDLSLGMFFGGRKGGATTQTTTKSTLAANMPFKVVVAGGGIAGNTFVGALLQRPDLDDDLDLRVWEATRRDQAPAGVNILMNHNGLAALNEMYPDLYERLLALPTTSPMVNWSARTVDGQVLYHLPDVTQSDSNDRPPLAVVPALVAQWNQVYQATRVDAAPYTTFGVRVVEVQEDENGKLRVRLEETKSSSDEDDEKKNGNNEPTTTDQWETDIDLLVAADGRYSVIREQLAPSPADYGPPCVIDYRIIIEPDKDNAELCPLVQQVMEHLSPAVPMWRIYHKPNPAAWTDNQDSAGVQAALQGYARVGLMRLGPRSVGLYGNIALPTDASVDPIIQTPAFMAALLESSQADALGQLTRELVLKYGHTAYWARKQQTDTCYTALDNRVLFIGDSAGGIYPSLGQGANLSLEDAVVAATVFPDVAHIATLRTARRDFIKAMSQYHARHLTEDESQFATEMLQWRGEDDGAVWHAKLRQLWSPRLALKAVTATRESFAPYGQLIGESLDGDLFDATTTDADLDLSQGTPRLYYMKLQGGRPLRVDRITRHKAVTQCLGALGTTEDFYLVVHRPDRPLSLAGLQAFCIPPRHFVKLHRGTWHVGPLWTGPDLDRTFVNLELADTNQVDHDTVEFSTLAGGLAATDQEKQPLVIPVMPAPLE